MIFCPSCGAPNQDYATECTRCGATLLNAVKPSKFKGTMVLQKVTPEAHDTSGAQVAAEREKSSPKHKTEDYYVSPNRASHDSVNIRPNRASHDLDNIHSPSVDALLIDLEHSRPISGANLPSRKPRVMPLFAFLALGFFSVAGPAAAVLGGLHLYDAKHQREMASLNNKVISLRAAVAVAALRSTCQANEASDWSVVEKSICTISEDTWPIVTQQIAQTTLTSNAENCYTLRHQRLHIEGCDEPQAGFTIKSIHVPSHARD